MNYKQESRFLITLSYLLKADISFAAALPVIEKQMSRKNVGAFQKVHLEILQGTAFSKSLKTHAFISNFSIRLIEAGERTGKLPEMLMYAGQEILKSVELKRRVLSAFLYPAFISVATIGLTLFLTLYIFPKILPLFSDMNLSLPISTRILLWLYGTITSFGIHILVSLLVLSMLFLTLYKKFSRIRLITDLFVIKIPLLGSIQKDYILATTARLLMLLLSTGTSLIEAAKYLSSAIPNSAYKHFYKKTEAEMQKGLTLGEKLLENPSLFPNTFTYMVITGEKSGSLEHILGHLSDMHESSLTNATKNLPNILEPILMVLMGAIVGFIAVSIVMPIYAITQNIK